MRWMMMMMVLVVGMAACGAPASGGFATIDVRELKQRLDRGDQLLVLDVRTPEEWKGGHLTMAKHINVNDADFAAKVDKLDKTKPVVVYCAAGGRSSRAATVLASRGFKTIYNVSNGGYTNLAATGLSTTTK